MLGVCCCVRAFSNRDEPGPLSSRGEPGPLSSRGELGPLSSRGELGLLSSWGAQASPLWHMGPRALASVLVAQGLSSSAACGIFPNQGWDLCPLH